MPSPSDVSHKNPSTQGGLLIAWMNNVTNNVHRNCTCNIILHLKQYPGNVLYILPPPKEAAVEMCTYWQNDSQHNSREKTSTVKAFKQSHSGRTYSRPIRVKLQWISQACPGSSSLIPLLIWQIADNQASPALWGHISTYRLSGQHNFSQD